MTVRDRDSGSYPSPPLMRNSWGLIRRARIGAQGDDAGRRSVRAKVAVTVAKLRQAKERFETTRDRYVERDAAIALARDEADHIIAALHAAPAGHAVAFAAELSIEPAIAQRILAHFIALTLGEIGDLRRQAVRDAERA